MLKKSKLILAAFIAVMMFIGFGAPAFAGILPTIDFEEDTVGLNQTDGKALILISRSLLTRLGLNLKSPISTSNLKDRLSQ